MEKLKQYKYIILIILTILGSVFYWFEWRPSQLIRKCQSWSIDQTTHDGVVPGSKEDALYFYGKCLRQYGIDK